MTSRVRLASLAIVMVASLGAAGCTTSAGSKGGPTIITRTIGNCAMGPLCWNDGSSVVSDGTSDVCAYSVFTAIFGTQLVNTGSRPLVLDALTLNGPAPLPRLLGSYVVSPYNRNTEQRLPQVPHSAIHRLKGFSLPPGTMPAGVNAPLLTFQIGAPTVGGHVVSSRESHSISIAYHVPGDPHRYPPLVIIMQEGLHLFSVDGFTGPNGPCPRRHEHP